MSKRIVSILGAFLVSAVAVVGLLRLAAPASAAGIIVVNPGESIQAAIDGAADGDTILIMAGTYTESLTLNKAVSLTGVSSATTILRAEPNDRVLTVTGATIGGQVVISGLMVTDGDASGLPPGANNGGGVALLNSAEPSFYNIAFFNNKAQLGGALYSSGNLMISGSTILSNTAEVHGGGLYVDGEVKIHESVVAENSANQGAGAYLNGLVWVTDSTVEGNDGNGINVNDGTLRATDSVIRDNIGKEFSFGAGVAADYLYLTRTTIISNIHMGSNGVGAGAVAFEEAVVIDSYFANNSCPVNIGCDGSGLRVYGPLILMQSIFVNNTAARHGGAVYAQSSTAQQLQGGNTAVLLNNLFVDNGAGSDGAALYFQSGVVEIVHNTIAGAALNDGQAVYVDGATAVITNTIIANHGVGIENDSGTVSEDYNVYFGNTVNLLGTIDSGGDSINGDPDFVDPVGGDYHIGADSAALDNGLNLGVLIDLDGNPRPYGAGPDRGAYEAQATPPSTWQVYMPVMFKP